MAYEDFYGVYLVKNTELKALAEFVHECGVNVGRESFASLAIGIDAHAENRIRQYAVAADLRLTALASHPIPDLPVTHPTLLNCDLSTTPELPTHADGRSVNSDAEALMVSFQRAAVELASCNSAALGGGIIEFDAVRCAQNIRAIVDLVDALTLAGSGVDFPETAEPAAQPASSSRRA